MKILSRVAIFILCFILAGMSGIFSANFVFAREKIDINIAPREELEKLTGIGPVLAQRIINARPFYSLDNLVKVRGIGPKTLERIKKQGLAWVSTIEPEPPAKPELFFETATKEEIKITYPLGIVINEILPSPEGPDETEEWIEIFNQNNFEVDLSDWKIEDISGKITIFTFPKGTKIASSEFLVLLRPTTKITLNNGGDGLNLIQVKEGRPSSPLFAVAREPDEKIIDSVSYKKAPRGQSYNRTLSSWEWSATLTPGLENIIQTQEIEGGKPPSPPFANAWEVAEASPHLPPRSAREREETGEKTEDTPAKIKPPQFIDINTASVKELQKIVGIGPVLAQRIIDVRPFYSINELTRVRGIGSKTLEDIKKQGIAWVAPELEPPKIEKEIKSSEKRLAAVAAPFKQGDLGGGIPRSLFVFLISLVVAIFSGTIILFLKKNQNRL